MIVILVLRVANNNVLILLIITWMDNDDGELQTVLFGAKTTHPHIYFNLVRFFCNITDSFEAIENIRTSIRINNFKKTFTESVSN